MDESWYEIVILGKINEFKWITRWYESNQNASLIHLEPAYKYPTYITNKIIDFPTNY